MSSKSRNSKLGRPFDPVLLKQAKAIASRYQIVLENEDSYWFNFGFNTWSLEGFDSIAFNCTLYNCIIYRKKE